MSTDKFAYSHRSVARSAGIIGLATLCSRILGLFRDIVIARLFGVYLYAQAFVIAFKIPNLFRDLLGEGAANAAIVPVFSEYSVKSDQKEFWQLANVILNLLLAALTLVTLLGVLFAPFIVRMIAPGFSADPGKLAATVTLTRIIFPYVLLICLAAYATAILNTLKHFSVPAFAPCLLNISIIACAMIFGESITGLASGVLAGGLLQLAIQVPVLYKKGFRLDHFLRRFSHPAAKTIRRLMLPRLFSSCIYQLNNFVDSIFGSLAIVVGEGGVAGLYFAYRLIQFPVGIFSNALSQAILPEFSRQALEDSGERIKHTLSFGLRLTFFVMLPASAGFMVLARPLVSFLFGGGRFDDYSAATTANVLFFYSIGLVAYGAIKIIQSCFFALKDTVTPAKVSALALCLNVFFNGILIFPMKLAGVALANSLSGIISFLVLFFMLKRKLKLFEAGPVVISFLKILAASLLMAAVCYFIRDRLPNLILIIVTSIVSYAAFCFILGVKEIRQAWEWIMSRRLKEAQ
ncbi:MAG: murein biosynthesis integral membrane protein MurJ [Candidatus Omnitrophota bacterium]